MQDKERQLEQIDLDRERGHVRTHAAGHGEVSIGSVASGSLAAGR